MSKSESVPPQIKAAVAGNSDSSFSTGVLERIFFRESIRRCVEHQEVCG